MVLTTPQTFGSPNVKGGSEKGMAQQKTQRWCCICSHPGWGGSDPPAREICHGLRHFWIRRQGNDRMSSSREPGPDGGIPMLSGSGRSSQGWALGWIPCSSLPQPRLSPDSSSAIL